MHTNRRVTVSLLLLGAGLTACTERAGEVEQATEREAQALAQLARADLPDSKTMVGVPVLGCTSHNVIGELDSRSGDCSLPGAPATPNWVRHQMFDDSTPDVRSWTEAVPGELQRYCSYEYIGSGPIGREHYEELFAAIDAYPGMSLESVAVDCRTEAAQGSGLDDPSVTAHYAEGFHRAVQWVPGSALRSTMEERAGVEVAVLDTVSRQADGDAQIQPVNQHGRVMEAIIAENACPDGDSTCSNTIQHHLAMPRHATKSTDWTRGGDFGTMGDLATSIVAAVGHWRMAQLEDPSAPKRLVINASLGWEPGAMASTVPERALERALEFAACNGALVIAAAGNVANPACATGDSGPLAPASYQLVEAPDAAECAQLGYAPIDAASLPVFGEGRPLVYAVGGVDGRDRPIVNGRPEAMPPLAAYADHVAVEAAGEYTRPLTGTSVSTAVVSATASLVWSYAPELTPDQVMRLIYDSGVETGQPADFGFVGAPAAVHRVSVCGALAQLCASRESGSCSELVCDDPEAPADGHLGGLAIAANAAIAAAGDVRVFAGPAGEAPVCESQAWDEQVRPQPEHPMCPDCMIDVPKDQDPDDDILSMDVDSEYRGSIIGVTLTVYDATGGPTVFNFGQDVVDSVNDPNIPVTIVVLDAPDTESANLTFTLDDRSTSSGAITVTH